MATYMTSQRRMLLSFLKDNHDKQLSANDIANALKPKGISLSAVYRNLAALEEQELISRSVKEGSREIYYQYTDAECCKNCIHLTCTKCGKVTHMDSSAATAMTAALRRTSGFNVNKSKTVVYGICSKCEQVKV